MSRRRRLPRFGQPPEVSFFLFLAAFALVITIVYGVAGREPAGVVLLGGFTIATGALGLRLAIDPRSERVPERDAARSGADVGHGGAPSEGTGGVDRPFLDEEGRLPGESLAPFAVGLGVAVAATGAIFGPAPILVGMLPLVWGAWRWLRGAGDELRATEDSSRSRAR